MNGENRPTLVIGTKNRSSWSLRPWLLLRHAGVAFDEVRLPLDTPEFYTSIGKYSPTGCVPALRDGDLLLWDSLAICEYVNERFLDGAGWPADIVSRARARAISAEMHSGFSALRNQCPLNCTLRTRVVPDAQSRRDIERITTIWRECRALVTQGPFLFGTFSIADAMYAPVVLRFVSYGIPVGPVESDYMDAMQALPALQQWQAEAAAE
ncbi:MAG: glutathione S-transferase family protein [Tahibacter sp.]